MKTKMKTIATKQGDIVLNKRHSLDCDIAKDWAIEHPGKFAQVSIGRGRLLAFHYNGTMTIMTTTPEASFPPRDCVVIDSLTLVNESNK